MIITSGGLFYEEKTDYRKTKLKQLKFSFSETLQKFQMEQKTQAIET